MTASDVAGDNIQSSEPQGTIFDIKRFAVHDGPGIRTAVFFKGCPLRCIWCHNPESISPKPELVRLEDRCVVCQACESICPYHVHEKGRKGTMVFHRRDCRRCGVCMQACPSDALLMYGQAVSVHDVMAQIRKDADFYAQSGGGVTLSGGEPLLQPDFAAAILAACRKEGFHTAVDTCGQVPWESFQKVLPVTDMVLYDVKHSDPDMHKRYTRVTNELVMENLRQLSGEGVAIEVRLLVIPSVNDGESLDAIVAILKSLPNRVRVRLLAYHRLAGSKYRRLGKKNTMPNVIPPADDYMRSLAGRLSKVVETVYD